MSRPTALGLLSLLALAVTFVVLAQTSPRAVPPGESPPAPARAEAPAAAAPTADPAALRREAEAFLATDRPWRAARTMRRLLAEVPEASAADRLLAARAEAGAGNWAAAHDLLHGLDGLTGEGLYLLARARDDRGDAPGAAQAYLAFLADSSAGTAAQRDAARLRLGLALVRQRDEAGARPHLAAASDVLGGGAAWLGLLQADALAAIGDTVGVRQAVAPYRSGTQGLRAWRARVAGALAAGDADAARRLAVRARAWASTDATRAEFLLAEGRAALATGDVSAARAALRGAIARQASGPHARAAAALLAEGTMTSADHLAVARVLRAQGLHNEALAHYRAWLDADRGTPAERADVQLDYADALFYANRFDEVEAALAPVADRREARRLRARTAAQRGDAEAAARLYLELADAPGAGDAGLLRFLAADAHHHAGQAAEAAPLYRQVIARHGGDLGGLSLMRLAGIAWQDGDAAAAGRMWDDYRARGGTYATQATYWAGRAREALGDTAAADALFRAVRQRDRDGYYAVLASERLGEPFWPLPLGASPPEDAAAAARVAGWMRGVDLLREAGFPEEASAEADRVVAQAGADRATRYALAEALIARGYSQRAIRIGLGTPNARLYRILYPFPYRALIEAEAAEHGVDPFVAAALIRQESMFEARATSPVGARGLMQVMPATGRTLAEAAGVERWDAELLYQPEVNVHLGTRYVAQHLAEFDGSLPSVFAAYNAGEHRVRWWSAYPEFADAEAFAERIPFRETREYVKILSRNRALYAGLYGG